MYRQMQSLGQSFAVCEIRATSVRNRARTHICAVRPFRRVNSIRKVADIFINQAQCRAYVCMYVCVRVQNASSFSLLPSRVKLLSLPPSISVRRGSLPGVINRRVECDPFAKGAKRCGSEKYFSNARCSAENFDVSRGSTADKHRSGDGDA